MLLKINFRFCICIFERSMLIRPFFFCLVLLVLVSCAVKHPRGRSKDKVESRSKSEVALLNKYSALVGAEVRNTKLYAFIDDWYETPHCIGGKSKSCVDCSGFSSVLYQAVYGVPCNGSSATIYEKCKTLKKQEVREGDFVFFRINQSKVSHMGVYLANDYFVHASTKRGVIISSLREAYYEKWFTGFGRLK